MIVFTKTVVVATVDTDWQKGGKVAHAERLLKRKNSLGIDWTPLSGDQM